MSDPFLWRSILDGRRPPAEPVAAFVYALVWGWIMGERRRRDETLRMPLEVSWWE